MISVPNRLGWITSLAPARIVSILSSSVSRRPRRCCASASRRRQFSTMITAPSTMMPKSIAPRLIRLALTLLSTMPDIVISMESGMTQAVISAARILPRIRNRTTMTSAAPSRRFFATVAMVASTRWVRS